jgi:hypothetical protein
MSNLITGTINLTEVINNSIKVRDDMDIAAKQNLIKKDQYTTYLRV